MTWNRNKFAKILVFLSVVDLAKCGTPNPIKVSDIDKVETMEKYYKSTPFDIIIEFKKTKNY